MKSLLKTAAFLVFLISIIGCDDDLSKVEETKIIQEVQSFDLDSLLLTTLEPHFDSLKKKVLLRLEAKINEPAPKGLGEGSALPFTKWEGIPDHVKTWEEFDKYTYERRKENFLNEIERQGGFKNASPGLIKAYKRFIGNDNPSN
ncbi:hypothetical protein [Gracilimonas mengyeensis]|uniref:Lipoprotein n=1 Tax=Gracilimonas mengyeensis TaxID=1302730 RepID=A0A521DUB1_9BACT|nr:hypothetical protein [Gracilimonas mengyeensis]SMO75306.1 hypothetical protein SAMN06265219_109113 [Gracilimonas mengyeensis]